MSATQHNTHKIHVVGAGIGGLTTALVLKQKGFHVNIYEGSDAIKPVGAGITLANNAMQVYRKLGIHEKIEKAGNRISSMNITDSQLNYLSKIDLSDYERKYGVHNIAIHRGALQKILAGEVGYENINLSKRLVAIEKGDFFKLTFEDGSIEKCGLVIGADGIKSVVRSQLFKGSQLRNAHQVCWRGVCDMDLPQRYHHELNEAWGKGRRFGFVKIGDNKVYWYALANAGKVKATDVDLSDVFQGFHADVLRIISATKKEQIISGEIVDLKPIDRWHDENVCLVGDAAHATTPNLGQGACQAVEDAYAIWKLLDDGVPIEVAIAQYEKLRKKKAHTIVTRSWTIGKMAHIENRLGVWLRNRVMKLTPKAVNRRQMAGIFELN